MKTIPTLFILALLLTSLLPTATARSISPPLILVQRQSAAAIRTTDTILLSAQASDDTALDKAYLSTNETGHWQTYSSWWDPHWTHALRLTVDHTTIPASLTGFPLLVILTTTDFATTAQPDGDDFLFTDAANTTQYLHEIESYDPATGSLIAWVRIPTLSATKDTTLFLYYGNPDCPSQQRPRGVWADYLSVLHFTGTAATSLHDSASNETLLSYGAPIYGCPGRVGTSIGLNTNASGSYLTARIHLPANSSYTQTVWVSFDDTESISGTIINGNGTQGFRLQVTETDHVRSTAMTAAGVNSVQSTTVFDRSSPVWRALCGRVSLRTGCHELFVDGIREAAGELPSSVLPGVDGIVFGANSSHAAFLHGRLDEFRLCARDLNDSWIRTEAAMMRSPEAFLQCSMVPSQCMATIHGSPLWLHQNSDPQWANFTWASPGVVQGTMVGWRIIFQDTGGFQSTTPVLSFQILGSPPSTPSAPSGPSRTTVGVPACFLVQAVDPDGDPVSYEMDYGDGSALDWSTASASGAGQWMTHAWRQSGEYLVKVRARDPSGAESPWSPPSSITVSGSGLSSLAIHAPTAVTEGAEFTVTVTCGLVPVPDATVRFASMVQTTNGTGIVRLYAPAASRAQSFYLTADHPEYDGAMITVIVVRTDSETESGWIYGRVTGETGAGLPNAQITVQVDGTMNHCVFTGETGRYTIPLRAGEYSLVADKPGYDSFLFPGVVVQPGQTVEVNLSLSPHAGSSSIETSDESLAKAIIDAGIAADRIAGRLDASDGSWVFSSYQEGLSASVVHGSAWNVSFTVSAVNLSGRVVAVRLGDAGSVDGVDVLVDGVWVEQVDVGEVLSLDGGVARFGCMNGEGSVVYCLVYVPQFSSHVVEVRGVVRAVSLVGLAAVYVGVGVVGLVGVLLPIVAIERKRR